MRWFLIINQHVFLALLAFIVQWLLTYYRERALLLRKGGYYVVHCEGEARYKIPNLKILVSYNDMQLREAKLYSTSTAS